jgi:formylglycine-generating enzyme required for sulfatase activity
VKVELRASLETLQAQIAAASSDHGLAESTARISAMEKARVQLDEQIEANRARGYPDTEAGRSARWWNGNLTKLIEALEGLEEPKTGLLSSAADAVSEEHGWSVARRLEFAQSIEERSVTGPDAQRVWSEAIASIAASPKYYGLTLTPQMGLIPIGPDPDSGFWEFAHLATGEAPVRDDAGRIVRTESMGVVLVLIPGGTFWMGAQKTDPGGQNYDPDARGNESPVHEVTLTAHFLSKYEMTQGQWQRLAGRNPAYYKQNKTSLPRCCTRWSRCLGRTRCSGCRGWGFRCRAKRSGSTERERGRPGRAGWARRRRR